MKRISVAFLFIWLVAFGCQAPKTQTYEKPLIGITTVYDQEHNTNKVPLSYVDAVLNNGGIPIVLPTIDSEEAVERYLKELDGLILIGGMDVPPSMYGQNPHKTVKIIPERRLHFERMLIARWMNSKKPILGTCLGMQFTNVVMGGTLIQDIPSQVGTDPNHYKTYHDVTIKPQSTLAVILNAETVAVYSSHHQAVDRIADGFIPVAHADDGVVEALERTDGGLGLFVQWHPEAMAEKHPDHTNAIYSYFVGLCRNGRMYKAARPRALKGSRQ